MNLATLLVTLRRLAAVLAPLGRLRVIAFALAAAMFAPPVLAEGISVRSATLEPSDDGWNVEGEFDVQFSQRLE